MEENTQIEFDFDSEKKPVKSTGSQTDKRLKDLELKVKALERQIDLIYKSLRR